MLLEQLDIPRKRFEAGTGWTFKPEGACKGDVCIPLNPKPGAQVNAAELAGRMGLPVVRAEGHDLWAIGPESVGGRALTTAEAPDLRLPDLAGNEFALSSLRGQKVVVYAWAPY